MASGPSPPRSAEAGRHPAPWRAVLSWPCAHPVAAYVLLTLAWSWTVWSMLHFYIGPGGLMRSPPNIVYAIAALGGLGPSLAGLTLTGVIDGRSGFAALGRRCRVHSVGCWWLALLLIPGVTALTPLARWFAGAAVDGKTMVGLLGPGLALGLAAGLMEEFGWRGFLLPRLRERHSALHASLFLGFVWGALWHGYADYFGVPGEGWTLLLLIVLLGPVLLTAWSLVLTVVSARTEGNLLLAVLMHASISSSALVFGQIYETPSSHLRWTAFGVVMAWCAAAVLWFANQRVLAVPAGLQSSRVELGPADHLDN